ncbi:protein ANTAGONIST OF LIKE HETEROCHROMATIN PROTEIN 1-like [Anneissia japonica]|uniref:protein ANTAGONIST OF LIKE HETEROCHROMATIN PROTEIN 1-like n=1 Tax=Anneissia japonica TaxID=1529436 RepID=UPI0014256C43|nr:protein ANTAGONIST OF LIKE HETEROCHROMATIN PROTEIN 1-like [Anneissia japonica]
MWVRPRPRHWWEYALTTFNDADWKTHFRMKRRTFNVLVDRIRPYVQYENTQFRNPIPLDKRVAISLWRLATPDAYRTIGELFAVGTSSACVITHEICRVMQDHLLPSLIAFPRGENLQEVLEGFQHELNFPQCVGAIDGSHIEI